MSMSQVIICRHVEDEFATKSKEHYSRIEGCRNCRAYIMIYGGVSNSMIGPALPTLGTYGMQEVFQPLDTVSIWRIMA